MNAFYRSIRALQDSAPPIRSKWVAVVTYSALASAFAWLYPAMSQAIYRLTRGNMIIEFSIFGALYGHCKWAIAVDRFWLPHGRTIQAPPTMHDPAEGQDI